MEKIIEVTGLKKSYKDVQAVKGIDFFVEKGTLFAFLGKNGAGKSTTIDMIATLLSPDAGTVKVNGFTLGKQDNEIRRSIGIVFQDSLLDPLLTVRENMEVRGSFYGLKGQKLRSAVEHAADVTALQDVLRRPYGKLSGGQRRRADIARALVHTPHILFLDEPTTGLDPQTRRAVWDTIRNLQRESGMTVFLTTHYMEEAAGADYVTIIGKGELLAQGTPSTLKDEYSGDSIRIQAKDSARLEARLKAEGIPFTRPRARYHIHLKQTADALPILAKLGEEIEGFEVISGTMEDVFLNVTQEGETGL